MALDFTTTKRRFFRRLRHLPAWLKAALVAVCTLVVFFGIISVSGAFAVRPEDPVASLGAANDTASSEESVEGRVPVADAQASVETARTAFDVISGSAEMSFFDTRTGAQRGLAVSEAPEVSQALEAFRDIECDAGFIVYDLNSQRGLSYNADAQFFSASTIKAPLAAFVLQDVVDSGQASLSDEMYEDITMEGTGVMAFDDIDTYDLATVLTNTIEYSDNTGYALLRDQFERESFENWCASAGVDASVWEGEWYPYYSPRDLAKLWLRTGSYLVGGVGNASWCESLFEKTDASFIRKALSPAHRVLAKPGYEIDTPEFDMGALNDAGLVFTDKGAYVIAVMSDADYDDEYFTDNEQLMLTLITALSEAHDRLLTV